MNTVADGLSKLIDYKIYLGRFILRKIHFTQDVMVEFNAQMTIS